MSRNLTPVNPPSWEIAPNLLRAPGLKVASPPAVGNTGQPRAAMAPLTILGDEGPEGRELMERVCVGDEKAFEQLVERFWERTLLYVRHLCGDPDRAYDVTQEAFGRLWARRDQWAGTGSVRIWLLRTARNQVISDQRRWKVRAHRAVDVAEEYRRVRTPLEDTEEMELRIAIRKALGRLSPRRREAFTLFHLQGLSYREISGIMGVRSQTVANYIQAAIADLRILLAHHHHTDPSLPVVPPSNERRDSPRTETEAP